MNWIKKNWPWLCMMPVMMAIGVASSWVFDFNVIPKVPPAVKQSGPPPKLLHKVDCGRILNSRYADYKNTTWVASENLYVVLSERVPVPAEEHLILYTYDDGTYGVTWEHAAKVFPVPEPIPPNLRYP